MHLSGKPQVMVVDDDLSMCSLLKTFLDNHGYSAITLSNAEEAVRRYNVERPAAVILDVVMPGSMDGLEALVEFKRIDRDVPIIVLSGQGRTATVVQAMKLGAADYVSKPFDEIELETPLANALEQYRLTKEVASLRDQLHAQSTFSMLFDDSPRMAEVQQQIERLASADVPVLISGESGTGKELVARALHASSLRRDKPLVKVNCSALPQDLLECELFGFERGAFASAIQDKPGKFEFANQATMFLDEISAMSLPLQGRLLRVMQEGQFARPGGGRDVRVDVRLVAATKRDLEQAVAAGQFREDVHASLNLTRIDLPPLRDRRDDVPLLARHFVKKYSVQYNIPATELSSETMQVLMDYDWPGNVRELETFVKRAIVPGGEVSIRKEIAQNMAMPSSRPGPGQPPGLLQGPPPAATAATPASIAAAAAEAGNYSLKDISRTAAREAERELIVKMLQRTRWNRKETAEILGISYKALLYKIKENGLDKAS
jgi:two-component system response regulator AtoC